jgi:hypothetical protein
LAYADRNETPGERFYVPGTEPTGPLGMQTPDGRYRYFMPAGGEPDCNFIYSATAAGRAVVPGPVVRRDGLPPREGVPAAGPRRFEFSAEVFNATKALKLPERHPPPKHQRQQRSAYTSTQSGRAPRTAAGLARELVTERDAVNWGIRKRTGEFSELPGTKSRVPGRFISLIR